MSYLNAFAAQKEFQVKNQTSVIESLSALTITLGTDPFATLALINVLTIIGFCIWALHRKK
ncbi:hypothetical protein C5F53_10410 [Rhodoferax sp. TS-BS-61-7]|nr:hypothetical protein C5F53_10410 [Rhodoferax sp. TS-BS-61-7]